MAYTGSGDDAALNREVARYAADPRAVAAFAADADPQGRLPVPVISAHAIHDATAFVEMQDRFARTVRDAGRQGLLVQAFTADRDHSYWSDASYVALAGALVGWVDGGERPAPLDSRVAPRLRP